MSHTLAWLAIAAVLATGIAVPVWMFALSPPLRINRQRSPSLTRTMRKTHAKDYGVRNRERCKGGSGAGEVRQCKGTQIPQAALRLGPRISGSDTMKKQQEIIEKHFKDWEPPSRGRNSKESSTAANKPWRWSTSSSPGIRTRFAAF